MRKNTFILLLIAGTLLSLVGCQKGTTSEYAGQTIRFGAQTGTPTRTAYSGQGTVGDDGYLTWERIDWVDGDLLMIASDKAQGRNNGGNKYATYSVYGATKSGNESLASIDDVDGKGLIWGDDPDEAYTFWGVYPASVGNQNLANGTVTFSIDANQGNSSGDLKPDMDKAVMLAKKTGAKPNETVILDFYPAYTAFEFVLTGNENNSGPVDLTKVELISTSNLYGTVTATLAEGTRENSARKPIGASSFSTPTNAGTVLTYTFPTGTQVTPDAELTFTVFALPIDINKLQLKFYSSDQEYVATLKKKGTDGKQSDAITFDACRKHKIYGLALPDGEWHLYLEADVLEWIQEKRSIEYGKADEDGVVVSASAVEFFSGVGSNTDRIEVTLSNATSPLKAYFSVYSPTNGKWRITLKGAGASQFVLTTDKTGESSATGDGGYLEGNVDGRVIFTLTPVENATSGASVELWFTVVMVEGEGTDAVEKEYLLHSEVTRSSLPLTVKLP